MELGTINGHQVLLLHRGQRVNLWCECQLSGWRVSAGRVFDTCNLSESGCHVEGFCSTASLLQSSAGQCAAVLLSRSGSVK